MIRQQNKMQVSCLWLRPVAVISFARIHLSRINTTNQSQEVSEVTFSCTPAGSAPPSHSWAVSALTWSDKFKFILKLWTMAEKQQSWKMSHHCPRQRDKIRRLMKKSSVKTENWTEPERKLWGGGAAGFVRTPVRRRVGGFSAGQVRTPASCMFYSSQ